MLANIQEQKATDAAPVRILRLPEVMRRTGLPRGSVYEQIAIGLFPKQVPLTFRTVGWIESEVDAWVDQRIQARRG